MDELTMVLDELENRPSGRMPTDSPTALSQRLPPSGVQKLIYTLQLRGGDMARIASVISDLADGYKEQSEQMNRVAAPMGSVRMPETRHDSRTMTAGNGVMTCTDA